MTLSEKTVSAYLHLDYQNYEQYFVVLDSDAKPVVSHVIYWQHPPCYNEVTDILDVEKVVDEEDILTSY